MEAITSALTQNHIKLVEYLLNKQTAKSSSEALVFVVRQGLKDLRDKRESNVDLEVIAAVENSIMAIIKFLKERGADVNLLITEAFAQRETIFRHICCNASLEFVKTIVDLVNLRVRDKYGRIPVQTAVKSRRDEVIDLLLSYIKVDDDIDRLHLLHLYVESKVASKEMVVKLLALGADINGISSKDSVVACAVEGGSVSIVKFLLENGAKLNVKSSNACLEWAVSSGDIEMVKLLLDNGADVHVKRHKCPLIVAAEKGFTDIVALLLDREANINERHNGIYPPVWYAAHEGHEETLKLLLERGADQDDEALVTAVLDKNANIVRILLNHGYNASCDGPDVPTICNAAYSGNMEIVKLLLEHGADVDATCEGDGQSVLHLAVDRGNVDTVRILLEYEANVNVQNDFRLTPLMYERSKHGNMGKLFAKRVVLMKAQNLYLSKRNWAEIKANESLHQYRKTCENEIELLKSKQFDDTLLSYFDIFNTTDVCKLASYARNENIVSVLKSNKFTETFPIYGEMILNHFNKGVLKNNDFELLKRFVNYLSSRDHDKLPKLPFVVIHELYSYLGDEGIASLKKL